MAGISIGLRRDTEAALAYLTNRWYPGQAEKRNAAIQRAIIEAAQREGMGDTTTQA